MTCFFFIEIVQQTWRCVKQRGLAVELSCYIKKLYGSMYNITAFFNSGGPAFKSRSKISYPNWLHSLLSSVFQASAKLIPSHGCLFLYLRDSLFAFHPIIRAPDTGLNAKQTKIKRLIAGRQRRTYCSWPSMNFMVAPRINDIKHLIVQLMHTNYKILRLLK